MEEIVLGLSKSVVEGTLSKVRSAIEEEAKLKLTVQSDLVFITGEFEMMQSFLNVADATERIRNNAVKTWVRQLRDLAYDTEDCIELVIHLDPKPTWWRRLPCLPLAASLPIDDAAAEVKQLKERVEHVSQRNMRYNLITGGASSVIQHQHQHQHQQLERIRALDIPFDARKNKKASNLDLAELIISTKDEEEEDSRRELGVISVWGIGGDLGVTSIIRKAYDDPEICRTFEYRGWAKLTLPLNPREILRSLLTQFCRNTLQKRGATTLDVDSLLKMEAMVAATQGDELIKEFVQHVSNHKYLVVLEDLSTMVEWDTIRMYLPDTGNGSQIIVSTQHFDIANLCTSQPYKVSEFRKFTHDHSVCVFSKEDSQRDRGRKMLGDIESSMEKLRLIGRETEKKQLTSQIGEGYRVISVWGIAGVGKSTLVRSVCYEHLQKLQSLASWAVVRGTRSTSYMHGWVNVSHPFNLREFCRSLLLDLSSEPPEAKEKAESDLARISDPIEVCREILSVDCKCLIVINNLQSAEEWDSIKQALLFGQGYCIIIVTTEASVAKHCSGKDEFMFNVKGLGNDYAFQLFQEVYNKQPNAYELDEDKNKQAKLILSKCGGLPKVIVAVGSFLAKILNWEAMNKSFMQQLETNPELDSVQELFGWLDSYFHTCPDFLKPCIFYLSIFPRGQGIRRRRLVRRWIAEGYSRDTDNGNLAEANGESYFSRLVDLSMVQQPPHGVAGRRMAMCYINDFFREYIISRQMEENHVFALEGSCSQTTQRMGRHLVIEESWNRDKNVFNRIDFSRLRSLTAFGSWEPFFTSDKMRVLRVLDLEGTSGLADDDIRSMVKRLPRLKFLSLRGCKDISRLPDSLGRLRQLETLDVRHTAVASIPGTITKLQKLQYVRAGTSPSQYVSNPASRSNRTSCTWPWLPACLSVPAGYHVSVDVPSGFGNLTNLHTLGVINATVAGLKELKNLTLLRKLGVSGINRKNHKELCSFISGHAHLESLSVWFDKDMQGTSRHLEDDILEPPEKLQSLKLHGHLHRLSLWIKKFPSLRMLDLEVSVFDTQNLEDKDLLQGLHHLLVLRLHILEQLQDGELHIAFVVDSLKMLVISCSSRLHVTFEERAIKNLATLKFRCNGLSSLELLGLENLNCIKEVLLEGSYGGGDLEKGLLDKLNCHPNNPVLRQVHV